MNPFATSLNTHDPKPTPRVDGIPPKVLRAIDALVSQVVKRSDTYDHRDLIREMIVTSLKAQQSQLSRGDIKILNRSLRELRYGFSIFKPYRNRRKVSIFGSARTPSTHPEYQQALMFARAMKKKGFMSITGAGPGIMQAGNQGAGKGNSFGINIRLPMEQAANDFIRKDSLFVDCRFFFTRKLMFLKETSAAAFFPGGFGTHDEGFETLTLVQTGKCDMMPLVFVDQKGGSYWKDWHAYIKKHLLKTHKISPADMSLFKVTDSVKEAVDEIVGFYRNYHSMRFVKDQLVIRLHKRIPGKDLERLQKKYAAICPKGIIQETPALQEESEFRDLPRIMLPFNRHDYGRLRQLIDDINRI